MSRGNPSKEVTVRAEVPLIYECNLNCYFCYIHGNDARQNRLTREQWQQFVRFFDSTGRWLVGIGTGEPFFHPDFVEFASSVTRKNLLVISTNLTHDLKEFIKYVPAERVNAISISLQPAVENDIEPFLRKNKPLNKA